MQKKNNDNENQPEANAIISKLDLDKLKTKLSTINLLPIEASITQDIRNSLLTGLDERFHKSNLENLVNKRKFLNQLNSSKMETVLTTEKPFREKAPVKIQIEKLFLFHEAYNPERPTCSSEISGDMKVHFIKEAVRGSHFFKTTTTVIQAAAQQASGLAPEMWFTVLSYLCLTQSDYSISSESTQGYEVLMKSRMILDLYVHRTIPLKNSISFEEFQNDTLGEVKQAFRI